MGFCWLLIANPIKYSFFRITDLFADCDNGFDWFIFKSASIVLVM